MGMNFRSIFKNVFVKKDFVEVGKDEPAKTEEESYPSYRKPELNSNVPDFKEDGVTGNSISGGRIIGYEKNPLFYDWRSWSDQSQEMLRVDPKLFGADALLKHTLLSAKWKIEPASESVYDRMLADYAAQMLGLNGYSTKMESSFESQLAKMLPYATNGGLYLEEVYYIDSDGKAWLKKWASREPTAHKNWIFDCNGELDYIEQYDYNNPKESHPISSDKLLVLTLNKTGSNLEGRGILRPCYSWFKLKAHMQDVLAIGGERWALPTPRITLDRAAGREAGYTDPEITEAVSAIQEIAQGYAAQARSYVQDTPFATLGTYGDGKTMDFSGPLDVITYCDQSMLTAFVLQFLEVGVGKTGSYSAGEVHHDAFRRSVINMLDIIADAISSPRGAGRGTIARLLEFNFGKIPKESLPKLVHTGLDVDAISQSLANIPGLVVAGVLTPTDDVEVGIRARLGFGDELPEEAKRTPAERVAGGKNVTQ